MKPAVVTPRSFVVLACALGAAPPLFGQALEFALAILAPADPCGERARVVHIAAPAQFRDQAVEVRFSLH